MTKWMLSDVADSVCWSVWILSPKWHWIGVNSSAWRRQKVWMMFTRREIKTAIVDKVLRPVRCKAINLCSFACSSASGMMLLCFWHTSSLLGWTAWLSTCLPRPHAHHQDTILRCPPSYQGACLGLLRVSGRDCSPGVLKVVASRSTFNAALSRLQSTKLYTWQAVHISGILQDQK